MVLNLVTPPLSCRADPASYKPYNNTPSLSHDPTPYVDFSEGLHFQNQTIPSGGLQTLVYAPPTSNPLESNAIANVFPSVQPLKKAPPKKSIKDKNSSVKKEENTAAQNKNIEPI